MSAQGNARGKPPRGSFGAVLQDGVRKAGLTQADVARKLHISESSVSRWCNNEELPNPKRLEELKAVLPQVDLSAALAATSPHYELYVSAPIVGLDEAELARHHDEVAQIVAAVEQHVDSVFWPGRGIRTQDELKSADLATRANMHAIFNSTAVLYVQFAEIVHPSSSLVELGMALGLQKRTTLILHRDVKQAFMLENFESIAGGIRFLPGARIYQHRTVQEACDRIRKGGREILGL